jgi:SAM-dependent methyltransferase
VSNARRDTIYAMRAAELHAMFAADEQHWWYRGRRRVLRAILDRLPLTPDARVLDAGCGSGRTLDELCDYGRACGVDLSDEAVCATAARGHDVLAARIEALPFAAATFDLITCLDVIEHTPDDRCSLRELRRVTRPGGFLVATVPAYPRMWSVHDEVNLHFRRYTCRTLQAAAADAGWEVLESTHFNSTLVPVAAAVRAVHRTSRGGSELSLTPAALNGVLELPLRAEARAVRHGMRLPVGLSLLGVLVNPEACPQRWEGRRQAARASSVIRSDPDGNARSVSA